MASVALVVGLTPAVAAAAGPVATETSISILEPDPTTTFGDTRTINVLVTSDATSPAAPLVVPTGTVALSDDQGMHLADDLDANGMATFEVVVETPTSWTITASYEGDAVYDVSSAEHTFEVREANPVTELTVEPNPASVGEAITFTAEVTGVAGRVPAGAVEFRDGGTVLGVVPLDGTGRATLATTRPGGTRHALALYDGADPAYQQDPSPQVLFTVDPVAPGSVTVSSTPTPSLLGREVTLMATVPGVDGGPVPTGPVTFRSSLDGELGSADLLDGVAEVVTATLTEGTHQITAAYGGDASYLSSESGSLTHEVQRRSVDGVTVTASRNPSVPAGEVTFTATVIVPSGAPVATGTVAFTAGGSPLGTAVTADGVAALTTSALAEGTHSIVAAYQGDAGYQPAESPALTHEVRKTVPGAVTVTVPSSSYAGTQPTFSAAVTAANGGPVATGNVTFLVDGAAVATAALSNGTASVRVSGLAAGSRSVVARYAGDASYLTADSAAKTHLVQKAPTTITLASSDIVRQGSSLTLVAKVAAPSGAAPVTGTVSFRDAGTVLGTVAVTNGQAVLHVSNLSVGGHYIAASYGGSSHHQTSPVTARMVRVTTAVPSSRPNLGVATQFADGRGDTGPVNDCRADINGFGAGYGNELTLAVGIDCATNPTNDRGWEDGNTLAAWGIDTNGDDAEDYVALFGAFDNEPEALLLNQDASALVCVGRPVWNGAHVYRVTFANSCIGNPASIRIWAAFVTPQGNSPACSCMGDEAPDSSYWSSSISQVIPAAPKPPKVSISDATVNEGHSGTRSVKFVVKLSAKSSKKVTVTWKTVNHTAKSKDYRKASGTITFKPGETKKTVTVKVNGDRTREKTEKFYVRLTGARNANIDDGTAVGTIRNDD
ncbi:MAG TPA: Ig-like domain repeat protein [Acidimicrobiia bacterium]|nr:Ig-like domain repeat protein [Acidimicrobiia bacterium]